MAIIPEPRSMGTYLNGVFYTSLGSTLYTKFEVKSDLTVASVPSLVVSGKAEEHSQYYVFFELEKIGS